MGEKNEEYKMPDDPTASDAQWKRIQQNTFTRWCNEHLKCANLYIHDIEKDLSDGLKLIALLQVLSHKKISRYNKKPTFRPQKIENIAIALKFIEDEQIKLVNIDASDILKGNLKLILGLIWTLILKYQISLPMMDDDEDSKDQTPKQALMGWVKSKLPPEVPMNNFNKHWNNGIAVGALTDAVAPGLFPQWESEDPKNAVDNARNAMNVAEEWLGIPQCNVKNFNKDWNDGIAIASLVESTAPGLFPEWEDLKPENKVQNAREAMKLAEDWLGVPQVITPEEITNPNVDELSVMTYVSYFPEAKLKAGAPLKKKMTDASSCSASGPGVEEHGVVVNKPADFTVLTSGSSRGKLHVQVFGPGRKVIDCNVQDNHDNTYSCQYTAVKQGTYDVHIRVGGHHIPKSPFRVNVASDLDVTKVTAKGLGLEPSGVIVGRPAPFEVNAANAGSGDLVIDVIDPKGNKKTEIKVEEKPGNIFSCMYMPLLVGRYVIVIKYGGKEVAKSPYHITVSSAAERVKIYGPGLEPGLKTGKPASFTIDLSEAGNGALDVSIEGPGKSDVKPDLKDNGDGTFTCTYKPTKPGQYIIIVKFDGEAVPKCPVKVSVGSTADPSKIKAWGSGLERGVEGRPAEFYVDCNRSPIDNLTVGVEGPGKVEVQIKDTGDGKATVVYVPSKPGKYIIHIRYDETDIKDSPYESVISKRGNVSKVYAEGPGLEDGNMAGVPAKFTVFAKGAGVKGYVQVKCVGENGDEPECKVTDNGDETFTVVYNPKNPVKYTITICFMDEEIPKSPVNVTIIPFCDPTKVKATGPGLEGGKVKKAAKFKIDASKAGDGGIGLTIEGPTEAEIKCDDHGDGTCSVEYIPEEGGDYKINVLFADQHVPGSPFTATISDDFDASKVKADGPGLKPGNKTGKPCDIAIDTRKAGKAKLKVEVEDEVGNPVKVDLTEEEPGLFASSYFPEKEGTHTVNITFGGKPIPKSPFKIKINPAFDASKVKVHGPGVQPKGVKSMQPTYFEIDATEAGEGNVDIQIEPVDESIPKLKDLDVKEGKKPNTYVVTYVPPKQGEYLITVTFATKPVPKSPYKIKVSPGCDASKVKIRGPGIEEPIVGQENAFTAECAPDAGVGELTCDIDSPSGRKVKAKVTDNGDGTYAVEWTPRETGKHKLTIKYGPEEVPGSPFYVDVLGKPDPSKVKCYGPGLENAFVGKPAEFTIETKNAGPGNLGLTVEGPEEVKLDCKDNGDGTCAVTYYPTKTGDYTVNITFDDVHVPDSPFTVNCMEPVDASRVKCTGPGVGNAVPASLPAKFKVDATKAGKAPLECEVDGPGGVKVPVDIVDNGDGTFDCSYIPEKKGRYNVSPKYGGQAVPGSPFRVSGEPTGDARKVTCSGPGLSRPHVGVPAPFEVDTTKAGKGKVNAKCKAPDGSEVPVKMVEEEGIVACEYVPDQEGPHDLEVLFGGEPVKGSPFKAKATPVPEIEKIKVPVLEDVLESSPCVDQQFEAPVDCSDVPDNKGAILTGKITTPSGKKEKVDVKDNRDGTFALNYTPKEIGKYKLDVAYDGIAVPGSPFEFEVTEGGPEKVRVYGKGIKKGVVAVPSRFTVDTKNAGPGDLSVAVEGPSKVDIDCVDNGDGTCDVAYVPVEAGEYDVIVKFDNQHAPGSTFKPYVVQDEPVIEVGKESDLSMSPDGIAPKDIPSLKGTLEAPSGAEKPVQVSEGPDGSVLASFIPDEPGKNLLHLKKGNKEIDGSPIPVMVREAPVIGQESEVPLECNDCDIPKDLPKMKGILTRPNGKEEPCEIKEGPGKSLAVSFVPEEPGKHLVKVFKNNKQIEDSPFVIMVEGAPDQYPQVGKPCDKKFHQPTPLKRSDISKMKGTLRRPTGKEEPVEVKMGPDDTMAVSFVPTEAGEHLVSVKKDGRHVPNSPFSIIVMEEAAVPTVGSECAANFDIPELDLPKDLKDLKGTLTRPNGSKEPLELGVGDDNSLAVSFVPKEPGKHLIGVEKRGRHVKGSPFEIMVEEAQPSNADCTDGPQVGRDCGVNLDIPELSLPRDLKNVEAVLTRPTGKQEPLKCDVGPDDSLAVNFTPTENGLHKIDVKKRGKPVNGSPFEIMVGPADKKKPVDEGPIVGEEAPVNLSSPDLNLPKDLKDLEAFLTRPSGKIEPIKCDVAPDGTLALNFVPEEPGKHLIDVKKNGKPIKGSPFEVMVMPADKRKPVEEGPIVGEEAPVNLSSPEFNLPRDLKDLKAVLTRPSGKKEPINCESAPDGTLALNFVPEETGKHLIDVTKKGKPIKGSPFVVIVGSPDGRKPVEEGPIVGEEAPVNLSSPDLNLPKDLKDLEAFLTRPSGKIEPIKCDVAPDGTLALNFVPEEPGKHLIDVKKNGKPIKGSPFEVMVMPADKRKPVEEGPIVGEEAPVNLSSPEFNLPRDLKDLKAVLTRPSGKKEPINCESAPDGTLALNFVPEETGKHLIDVTKKGKPIKGSPFVVIVGSPDRRKPVEEGPIVGEEAPVNLSSPDLNLPKDLKDLEAFLTRPSGKIEPIKCDVAPDGTLALNFVPEEPGKHLIDVKKNGKPIKGSPFEVMVMPADKRKPVEEGPVVGEEAPVNLSSPEFNLPRDLKDLKAVLTRPSGKKEPINCESAPDGTLALNFVPEETGKHLIDVTKKGKPIKGSPFVVIVGSPDGRKPVEEGPIVGEEAPVNLSSPDLNLPKDLKDLEAFLTRPSGKIEPIKCDVAPDGTLALNFVPEEPGKHLIDVKKNGKPIKGSPFEVMVMPADKRKPVEEGPVVGEEAPVNLSSPEFNLPRDLKDLKAVLTRPSGKKEPINCESAPDGTLALNFVPEETGKHLIDVTKKGKPIKGSPFVVIVGSPDGRKPVEEGPIVGEEAPVNLSSPDLNLPKDLKDLEAFLTRPSGKIEPIKCDVAPDGTLALNFVPEEPGKHLIDVKKNGKPIKGSPFEVMVMPADKRKPVEEGPIVGEEAPVNLSSPEFNLPRDLKDLKAVLTRPSGKKEPIKCESAPDGTLALNFVPEETGKHLIDVTKKGKPIKGSPFVVIVGSPDGRKPVEEGPIVGEEAPVNLSSPDLNLPKDLKDLEAFLTRPSGKIEPIKCDVAPDGTLALNFVPEEPGKHLIDVKKNGKPIKGSPFEVMVMPADKRKPVEEGPIVGEEAPVNLSSPEFNLPRDLKDLKAVLTRPSGKEEPIKCESAPDGTLALNFVPEETGKHLIDVTKKGKPIKGSPFVVIVGSPDGREPVEEGPIVGEEAPVNLSSPDLNLPKDLKDLEAFLTRPSGKIEPIKCDVAPDGTLALNFVPEEPGKHLIDVKKNGKPIKGSPFEVMVMPADKRKPVEEGPIVGEEAPVNLSSPEFNLPRDLKDLKAVLTRPSGKKEPIKCESAPDGTLALNFVPEETGKHLIDVTKKGKPIKGSPFVVIVGSPDGRKPVEEGPIVGEEAPVNLSSPDLNLPKDLKDLEAFLTRPSGKIEPIKCDVAPDGTLALNFVPEEPGKHLIDVKKNGKPIKGSPFEVMVMPADKRKPVEEGPIVGEEAPVNLSSPEFNLPRDLKDLKAVLTRPSGKEEPIKCESAPDGTLALNFVPEETGKHLIDVTKKGKPIKGSPFVVIVGSPDGREPVEEGPIVGEEAPVNLTSPDLNLPKDLKDLAAFLTRPSGKKEPLKCDVAPDGSLALNFVPEEVGKHMIDVKKNGKPIKGSPFEVMVGPAREDGPQVGRELDVNLEIPEISMPRDLKNVEAELTRPTGKKEPLECNEGPDGALNVGFVPKENGLHFIGVKKSGKPVKGSPFPIQVGPSSDKNKRRPVPVDEIIVPDSMREVESAPDMEFPDELDSGKAPTVGSPCDVNLDIDDVKLPDDIEKLSAELTRPSGKKEPVQCNPSPDGSLAVSFTPEEVGKHLLDIKKNKRPVKGSPFEIMVEEAVAPGSKPTVGNQCDVDFDIPDIKLPADLKDLKAKLIRPTGAKEDIPCSCSPEHTLSLSFTPKEPGKHVIEVTKRGKPVKGSPFVVMVEDEEPSSKAPTVGSECDVNLDIPGLNLPKDFKSLEGSLKRPGERAEEPLTLVLNDNNTIGVSFVPQKPGRHEISIKKNGRHVSGSPFEVMVEPAPSASQEPVVGSPVEMPLGVKMTPEELASSKGTLKRPTRKEEEPLELKLNKQGQVVVVFTPRETGIHVVTIKRRGKHVPGSPIEIMVGAGKKKPTCDVGFEIPGIRLPDDLKYLKGSITSPSGTEEPVELQAGPNNTIVVSFVPKEAGKHYINIKKHGKHVGDSPYEVVVKPEDVAMGKPDASKVKCYGSGLRQANPNKKAQFTVDTRNAGYGGLGLSVEGPSKVDINCVDNEDGTCSVDFTPAELGQYLINVTYADAHVPGSPFKCRVGDGPIDDDVIVPISESGVQDAPDIFSDIIAIPSTKARAPQDFVIKFSGSGDLKASVTRPSGIEDDAEVVETGPDTYTVRFVPRETGEHLVNVKSRRRHIPGSPFKVLVEAPAGGAGACKASGPGLDGGVCHQPCRFTVITRDAGPGGLAVAVEGPAKAEIQCHDNGDGSCDITWYPVEPGEYTIHIRFADEAIPSSPFKVNVVPADDSKAMSMESFKDQVLRVGQQASFAVQMKGKKGKISASVSSPSAALIECTVAELDEGNYAVRFVPRELGDHLVSVFLDGNHIPGSPFTVKVGGLEGDPSKVVAYGPGLKGGVAGRPAEFTVNALDAGSGALALSIDGPAKVKMNCVEQDDGTYKVIYNPTVCGTYEISIRFAGQHIPGSAYKVRIVESEDEIDFINIMGDASKCDASGPGLKRAYVGKPATFTVNASNAGRGSIMVGVEGPIIPAKEIIVKHTGGNIYSVNYVLEEAGDYVLKVLWADKHIPGSPFHITV